MRLEKILVIVLVLLSLVFSSGAASAQTVSALMLGKSGASEPEVQPCTEIPAGHPLRS